MIAFRNITFLIILIFSIPTFGDTENLSNNLSIKALKQSETSVLFVEHDMEIVERYVDRVMAFYQGEIICDAPPKEALSDNKVIEYVLGR